MVEQRVQEFFEHTGIDPKEGFVVNTSGGYMLGGFKESTDAVLNPRAYERAVIEKIGGLRARKADLRESEFADPFLAYYGLNHEEAIKYESRSIANFKGHAKACASGIEAIVLNKNEEAVVKKHESGSYAVYYLGAQKLGAGLQLSRAGRRYGDEDPDERDKRLELKNAYEARKALKKTGEKRTDNHGDDDDDKGVGNDDDADENDDDDDDDDGDDDDDDEGGDDDDDAEGDDDEGDDSDGGKGGV